MAIIANVSSPFEISTPDRVIARFAAFTVTPSAAAFVTDIENAVGFPLERIPFPLYSQGALSPESPYLEPNLGQIWPRTG